MANKVQFGLKNVHYALLDLSGNAPLFGAPVAIPGAVTLTMDEASGGVQKFYADNMVYWRGVSTGSGYSGSLEVAKFPEQMLRDVWGMSLNADDGVLVENANVEPKPFALLYQIDGDQRAEYYVLYNCMGTRPGVGSTTRTDTTTPTTQTSNISCDPLPDGDVMGSTRPGTAPTIKAGWFSSVYKPANTTLSALSVGGLTLSPAFDPSTVTYTAATENAKDAIAAIAANPTAVITIKNGNTVIENGGEATWATGSNTLTVKVTVGTAERTYTVTVTKS